MRRRALRSMEAMMRQVLLVVSVFLTPSRDLSGQEPDKKAIAAIEALGGKIRRDPKKTGGPVTAVSLRRSHATDASLIHVKKFTELRLLDLSETKVTDQGLKELQTLKTSTISF